MSPRIHSVGHIQRDYTKKALGRIADALADLGKPEEIGKVFSGFQRFLYQESGVALRRPDVIRWWLEARRRLEARRPSRQRLADRAVQRPSSSSHFAPLWCSAAMGSKAPF